MNFERLIAVKNCLIHGCEVGTFCAECAQGLIVELLAAVVCLFHRRGKRVECKREGFYQVEAPIVAAHTSNRAAKAIPGVQRHLLARVDYGQGLGTTDGLGVGLGACDNARRSVELVLSGTMKAHVAGARP